MFLRSRRSEVVRKQKTENKADANVREIGRNKAIIQTPLLVER